MQDTHLILSDFRGRIPTRGTCSLCRQRFEVSSWSIADPSRAETELKDRFASHYNEKHSDAPANETASLRLRQAMMDLEN